MEEKVRQTYLYDFYGELLNEHQRRVYEDFVCNDLSLSEIAAELGISRQGVADMMKRCEQKLCGYEEKLRLLEKFLSVKEKVANIRGLCERYEAAGMPAPDGFAELMEQIEKISSQILEEL